MAKLIVLALAFAALVAFASAYTTIVTTTIDDQQIPYTRQSQQCQQQLQQKQFNQCHMYLQQGQGFFEDNRSGQKQQSQILQQCCNELQNVHQQCQCEAVKQVFQDVQQIQGQVGAQQIRQLKQKAQKLPNKCNLQVQSCPLPTVITTTTVIDENRKSGSQSQQSCYQRIQGQQFQQCQRYIQQAQQSGSYGPLLMVINKQGQQYQQQLKQCCNELERVESECQCEALEEIYRQAQQQQQQGSRRGGQQQQQMQENGQMYLHSIEKGPYHYKEIIEPANPEAGQLEKKRIQKLVDLNADERKQVECNIRDRVNKLMDGIELTKQERETKLADEFDSGLPNIDNGLVHLGSGLIKLCWQLFAKGSRFATVVLPASDDELTEKGLKQIEADDQAIQTILLSLPEDIYAAVDSRETAQEIWLRVQQMIKGSDIGIQEKKAKKRTSLVESDIQTNATMADNRTMAQMLQAPIEGYEDAIVVPPINANNFELKQTLINLVQSNQFTGRQDPHNHLRFFNKITSTF
nr:2S seed storage protein-like [Tanacetum cinerariifolium]